jgi:integrase
MAFVREINGRFYANWTDPRGTQRSKACGKGARGKSLADQKCQKIKALLVLGEYDDGQQKVWGSLDDNGRVIVAPTPRKDQTSLIPGEQTFMQEYFEKKLSLSAPGTQRVAIDSLSHFTRIIRPRHVRDIDTRAVDQFIAMRSKEYGKDKKNRVLISPATVNKDLRVIRAALRCAHRWGYFRVAPIVQELREEQKLISYISEEQLVRLYHAVDAANRPNIQGVSCADFWRGLLVFLFLTGWRIGQTLELLKSDVNLQTGEVFSPAKQNKGRRDVICRIHPMVIEHLRPLLNTFDEKLFALATGQDSLGDQFTKIQRAAGIEPPRGKTRYGFHDLRRGFATANAASLDLFELQRLMQHKSLATTQKYVSMAKRDSSVDKLKLPGIKMPGPSPKVERGGA